VGVLAVAKKMRNQSGYLIIIFLPLKHMFATVVADIFTFKNKEAPDLISNNLALSKCSIKM
jgi:hypothetical protein